MLGVMDCTACQKTATHETPVGPLCQHHFMAYRKYGYVGSRFPDVCTVDGCSTRHTSGGYCSRHYRLVRATGGTDPLPRKNGRQKCTVEGCDRWRSSFGLCDLHRAQAVAADRQPVLYPGRTCDQCGGEIPAERPKRAIYCSRLCKIRAMNARQNADPTTVARARSKRLEAKFGITAEQYDAMLATQGGQCAICHRLDPRGRGRFHVDHDHATGRVRGLLCTSCNTGLGQFLDDSSLLEAAMNYLNAVASIDFVP